MSDEQQTPDSYDKPEPKRMTGNVSPLTWVVLVVLLGAILFGAIQKRQTHHTPGGGTIPSAVEAPAYMPAAPASGDAPATPGGVVVNEK